MTREEAIRKLQKQKAEYLDEWVDFSGVADAYDMAIEALQAETIPLSVADKIGEERERLQEKVAELQEKNADRPHGEWVFSTVMPTGYKCSVCGRGDFFHVDRFKFCPFCGADMRGGK